MSIKFDPCLGLRLLINMSCYENVLRWIKEIQEHLKSQEMYDETVGFKPRSLAFVPDCFKTQKMCNQAVQNNPRVFFLVPDNFKTQEMREKVIEEDSSLLDAVPGHFKTKRMCDDAVLWKSYSLVCVPDWFGTRKQIKIWQDDDEYYNHDLFEWYKDYKKWKAQKASIKEELMRIAWDPDRVMDWCISEDEKRL